MLQLQGQSVSYRIAVGPRRGQKVLMLQTIPAQPINKNIKGQLASVDGFSLHAGVAVSKYARKRLENVCRYITRLAVSNERLSLTEKGKICYELKTPFSDGTTHMIYEPLDFMSKLAALVPIPRINLTRYHGVFSPNSSLRKLVTGHISSKSTANNTKRGMTWAGRLKRVFNIDITVCTECGGKVKIISCIENKEIINKILKH